MKSIGIYFALGSLTLLSGFVADSGDAATAVLEKVSAKLRAVQSLTYYQKRMISDPAVREYSTYEGEVHLDYGIPSPSLDCRFQFQNPKYLLVYNGSESFECDKLTKTLTVKQAGRPLFNGYSFLNNSLYTLRKALPGIIANEQIIKTLADTTIENQSFLRVNFSIREALIDNLGDLSPINKGLETRYQLLVDKQTFLPYLFIRQNNVNRYSVKVFFSKIRVPQDERPDQSWYYSNYQEEYKFIQDEQFNLVQSGTNVADWTLPLSGASKNVSLNSDYKGKFVLMEFWIRNCSYCISAVGTLNDMQQLYGKEKLAIVGVNIHDPEQRISEFIQLQKVSYPVVSGGDALRRALGVGAFPTVVLVGPHRKVIYAGIMDKAKLEKVLKDNILPRS